MFTGMTTIGYFFMIGTIVLSIASLCLIFYIHYQKTHRHTNS